MARWTDDVVYLLSRLSLCLLVFCLSHQASASPPIFDNAPYVTTLYELENTAKTLVTFSCSDPDNDPTVVSLPPGGVNPPSPCGSCFSVLPCSSDYCLIYSPVDTLNRQTTQQYSITVSCTDGNQTVEETVDVRLTINNPPRFDPNQFVATKTLSGTNNKKAGAKIYEVAAVDDDNDTITFSMTSDPASDNFEIGTGDGVIRAKNDLSLECNNFITFKVNITDGINNPVGPLSVQVTLDGANEAPDITNLDVSLQVPEDTAVGDTIRTISATDDASLNKLTYTLAADPASNLGFFDIVNGKLQVKSQLNYETLSTQKTNLTVVVDDGSCTSPVHYVHITVTDVNEPPDIQPENAVYSVYEGSTVIYVQDLGSQLTIPWNIIEEDFTDSHTYSITGGNALNLFSMDTVSGQLTINGDYDVDNNAMPATQTLTVQVTDKGGLTDTTTVQLNFKDRNDNRPVITTGDFAFSVCETSRKIGATLGTMTCTDEDSSFQANDVTYFVGGGSGITVLADGGIIMSSRPSIGQTFTTQAYCWDRGVWPSPLQSLAPMSISVTGVECTTVTKVVVTQAPTTTAAPTTTTTAAPTTTPPPSTDNVRSWIDENLPWIIIAALLATALLALLAYMLAMFCWRYCIQCCRNLQCCKRRPPRPRRLKTPVKKITPVEEPPPTPPVAIVGTDAYLYDFWKERYPDDDYGKQPNRKANPRPVTPQNNNDQFGNGDSPGQNGIPKKKSRCCTIL